MNGPSSDAQKRYRPDTWQFLADLDQLRERTLARLGRNVTHADYGVLIEAAARIVRTVDVLSQRLFTLERENQASRTQAGNLRDELDALRAALPKKKTAPGLRLSARE